MVAGSTGKKNTIWRFAAFTLLDGGDYDVANYGE